MTYMRITHMHPLGGAEDGGQSGPWRIMSGHHHWYIVNMDRRRDGTGIGNPPQYWAVRIGRVALRGTNHLDRARAELVRRNRIAAGTARRSQT